MKKKIKKKKLKIIVELQLFNKNKKNNEKFQK